MMKVLFAFLLSSSSMAFGMACRNKPSCEVKTVTVESEMTGYLGQAKCSTGVITSEVLVKNQEILAHLATGNKVKTIELTDYKSETSCDRGGAFCAHFENFNAKIIFDNNSEVLILNCKRKEDAGSRF